MTLLVGVLRRNVGKLVMRLDVVNDDRESSTSFWTKRYKERDVLCPTG